MTFKFAYLEAQFVLILEGGELGNFHALLVAGVEQNTYKGVVCPRVKLT